MISCSLLSFNAADTRAERMVVKLHTRQTTIAGIPMMLQPSQLEYCKGAHNHPTGKERLVGTTSNPDTPYYDLIRPRDFCTLALRVVHRQNRGGNGPSPTTPTVRLFLHMSSVQYSIKGCVHMCVLRRGKVPLGERGKVPLLRH